MSAIPGAVETDRQPPMTVPLRYFLVGLAFLVAGGAVGVLSATGAVSGLTRLAHVHLLLVGWVCVTILGAMTQFIPVWSNVALHSRRLATVTLWFVAVGVAGMAWSFSAGAFAWVHAWGGLALVGFWTAAYNLGRTLSRARPWDVTERHFAVALAWFVVVPAFGLALAMGYLTPVFAHLPVTRVRAVAAHATLAVFGIVLTTILGAMTQLAPMFTQTDVEGGDRHLQRVEAVAYPAGVVALAAGRLVDSAVVARAGAALVVVGVLAFAVVVARLLATTRVEWTPMLSRYAVVAVAMAAWALAAARDWLADPVALARGSAWVGDPLAPATQFGGPPHLLFFGVVGFVVLGTLYHVVPFIVWVHRYSDLLGHEPVPMIDDLYDDRIAAADFVATVAGGVGLVAAARFDLPSTVTVGAGALATLGFTLVATNLLLVVREHGPGSLRGVFVTRLADGSGGAGPSGEDAAATTDGGTATGSDANR